MRTKSCQCLLFTPLVKLLLHGSRIGPKLSDALRMKSISAIEDRIFHFKVASMREISANFCFEKAQFEKFLSMGPLSGALCAILRPIWT